MLNTDYLPLPGLDDESEIIKGIDNGKIVSWLLTLGYGTESYFMKNIGILKTYIFLLLVHILFIPYLKTKPFISKYRFAQYIYRKINQFFHMRSYIRLMFEAQFMLIIFGIITLVKYEDPYSTILAITVFLILGIMLVSIPIIRFKYRKSPEKID